MGQSRGGQWAVRIGLEISLSGHLAKQWSVWYVFRVSDAKLLGSRVLDTKGSLFFQKWMNFLKISKGRVISDFKKKLHFFCITSGGVISNLNPNPRIRLSVCVCPSPKDPNG